ncbi:MAG: glycosyltransferase family 2 protein, partial [Bacteroidota bacterium]
GSEDGHMALMLMKVGHLKYVSGKDSRAWTSDRRLHADGGLKWAFAKRIKKEGSRLAEYLSP